jgi:hypothetical protein
MADPLIHCAKDEQQYAIGILSSESEKMLFGMAKTVSEEILQTGGNIQMTADEC